MDWWYLSNLKPAAPGHDATRHFSILKPAKGHRHAISNRSEPGELVDFCMSNLRKAINTIMINFAPDDFGKIVLLAGSAGLPVAIDGKGYCESFNYLLTANNWRKIQKAGLNYQCSRKEPLPVSIMA